MNIGRYEFGNVTALRASAAEQKVLARSGDDLRIEWGSLYLAIPHGQAGADSRLMGRPGRSSFARTGKLTGGDITDQGEGLMPRCLCWRRRSTWGRWVRRPRNAF